MAPNTANPASAGARTGSGNDVVCFSGEQFPDSAPAQKNQARNLVRLRRQRLVEHLHRLGASPLGHFLHEVEAATGFDVTPLLERYARLDPKFIRALGGDRFAPSLHCMDGGEP